MTTLKERFDLEVERGEFYLPTSNGRADFPAIKKFFRQELLALAEEVEKLKEPGRYSYVAGFNQSLSDVANLIRSKANELN